MSVSVNGPKTPITKGSNGIATATLPNICKMPGPPAPFVPAPLPNIGKSGDKVKGYSKKVKVKKKIVAIKGASFGSMGDMASKGTGGGMISANTHGPCKFISPGSLDVKFEGKNVQLLTDMVTNNGGPSGSPANAATMMGTMQPGGTVAYVVEEACPICGNKHKPFGESVKKTSNTRAEAKSLVNAYNNKEGASKKYAMIAVVHCTRGHKFARKSGGSPGHFNEVASDYHHTTESATNVSRKLEERAEGNTAFEDALADAASGLEDRNAAKDKQRAGEELTEEEKKYAELSRNPIGSCAAQGALVLALDHNCTPKAMTEALFNPKGRKTDKMRYINKNGVITEREFKHNKSVPPCETCNLIIPFLVCPEEEKEECGTNTNGCICESSNEG